MLRRCAWLAILVVALATGCSQEEEEPYADSIPDIPPGRASGTADEGGHQPPAPSAPK